ncbi:Tyrosine-protein phosphatase non-receptor type 1 [Sarcoptes scabiei]|nr:Tyrosine-protein phosphatase non-receptor type 1 [Sarcoptes scabiei]
MEAEFNDYEKNNKWREIFRNINSVSPKFPATDSRRVSNRYLNRYMDVVPYDKTRVKLKRFDFDYINASYVSVPTAGRKYILTQGPLPNTSGHFWLMVLEQNTKAILMLNNLIECGVVKCHRYWPENERNKELIFPDVNIKVQLISMEKFDFYSLRKFILYDLSNDSSREILHYHYTSWPDFDLPKSSDSFLEFLSAVRASGCLNNDLYGPTVIHCSAGIGRSGTFVLVDSCLVMIEQNKCRDSINIIDVLLEIRNYRMGLIQTHEQLRFSFLSIIEGSKHFGTKLQNANNKIKRLFGFNEEDGVENDQECIKNSNSSSDGKQSTTEETDMKELNENSDSPIEESNNVTMLQESLSSPSSPIESSSPKTISTEKIEISNDVRQRKIDREERRKRTLDSIERIKRKQKETEERFKDMKKQKHRRSI